MEAVALSPGLGVAEGLAAFAEGEHQAAFARLRAARGELIRIGGSHAQRDVFERLTIEAALRAGALAEAGALIDDRVRRRGAEDNYTARRRAFVAERVGSGAAA